MAGRINALVVMPPERQNKLTSCLKRLVAQVRTALGCQEAAEVLRREPGVQVVLTGDSLNDGTWRDVLRFVQEVKPSTQVVVCPRLADERLWAQVLEAGAFDVLVEPYQDSEVLRIIDAAAALPSLQRVAAAT